MAIWNDEEYLVANLTDKTEYATAEICKFNSCLCILSSSAGIIFFLTVFLKGLVKKKNNKRVIELKLVYLLNRQNGRGARVIETYDVKTVH